MASGRLFQLAYHGGMTLALLVTAYAGAAIWLDLPATSYLPLAVGLPHMLLLSAMAWALPPAMLHEAGTQTQTAGYLHTLFGFSVVLMLLGASGEISAQALMAPLGSALVTSIVGWWVGGEMVRRGGGTGPEDEVKSTVRKLVAELGGFAAGARTVHEDYLRVVRELVAKHEEADERLRQTMERSAGAVDAMAGSVDDVRAVLAGAVTAMEKVVRDLREASNGEPGKKLANGFRSTSAALAKARKEVKSLSEGARGAAQYLRESAILITELSRLVDAIASSPGVRREPVEPRTMT